MAEHTLILNVEGMSCEHCVKTVTDASMGVDGVTDAQVDLEAGTAAVTLSDQAAIAKVIAAIKDEGYGVV